MDVCPRLTPTETDNNGTARRVHPRHRWWVGWVCGGGGGASAPAIFLLSACQTKVREHIRGARLWSAEVGSLFMQAMGWKTSGFSIFVALATAFFCAFVCVRTVG